MHVTIFSIGGNSALLRFLHSLHALTLVARSYVLLIHTHSHTYLHMYTYIPAPTQTHTHVHTLNTSISHVPSHDIMWTTRVSFSFLLKGSKMRLYGLLGGQAHIRVQSMWQTRGVRGMLSRGDFDFGPFDRHNLVESGAVLHKHNSPVIVSLNWFTCEIEFPAYPRGGKPKPRGWKCPPPLPPPLKETLITIVSVSHMSYIHTNHILPNFLSCSSRLNAGNVAEDEIAFAVSQGAFSLSNPLVEAKDAEGKQ